MMRQVGCVEYCLKRLLRSFTTVPLSGLDFRHAPWPAPEAGCGAKNLNMLGYQVSATPSPKLTAHHTKSAGKDRGNGWEDGAGARRGGQEGDSRKDAGGARRRGRGAAEGQLISVSKTRPYARRWFHIVYLYRNNPHQSWGFLDHLHNSSIILAKASCKSGSFQVLISRIDAPLPPPRPLPPHLPVPPAPAPLVML